MTGDAVTSAASNYPGRTEDPRPVLCVRVSIPAILNVTFEGVSSVEEAIRRAETLQHELEHCDDPLADSKDLFTPADIGVPFVDGQVWIASGPVERLDEWRAFEETE